MPLNMIPDTVDPQTLLRMEQSGQPLVVYECKLQEAPCGMCLEGTTSAVSAHIRRHGIIGPDSAAMTCTWRDCYKTLKKGSMARHILTHLGIKVCCSACGVVKCRRDLLRTHINSSEPCHFAIANNVPGPEGYDIFPSSWVAAHMHEA